MTLAHNNRQVILLMAASFGGGVSIISLIYHFIDRAAPGTLSQCIVFCN